MPRTEAEVYEMLKRERPELLAYHKFIAWEIQKAYRDGHEDGFQECVEQTREAPG